MLELLQMWLLVEILGIISLPLTTTVFHNLPDRGWAFSKAVGMAVLAFGVWFPLMTLRFLPFNQVFILAILLIVIALNVFGLIRARQTLIKLVRTNIVYIAACELIFLGMILLLGWLRSFGPGINSYEMFMDEGFIAAIMRSPHLPPNDMWYSGYSINYYYYAHFVIAMLAKLINQAPAVAFNTGISIYFGLTAVCLFGVTTNIVGWARYRNFLKPKEENFVEPRASEVFPSLLGALPFGILSMFMGLFMGNLASTRDWFIYHGDLATDSRWFLPSRVINKTINEFPAFSFLLSCFHAHVLALAFTIVGIGLAFNLLLAEGRGLEAFGHGWRMVLTLFTSALLIGGLFTMNGWDFPTYLGLALICLALQHWVTHKTRWSWTLVVEFLVAGGSLIVLSFLLYLPFYLNFVSPSQGIGIVVPADRSPIIDEVLIYGTFVVIFVSLLTLIGKMRLNESFALEDTAETLDERGVPEEEGKYSDLTRPRFKPWLIWLLFSLALVAVLAVLMQNGTTFLVAGLLTVLAAASVIYLMPKDRSFAYVALLAGIAFGLVAVCEVVYLRDVFVATDPRMNTVFKFYFQSWAMLSVSSSAGVYFIIKGLRMPEMLSAQRPFIRYGVQGLWSLIFLALLLAGTVYPVAGAYGRTGGFAQRTNSLDGLEFMQSYDPGDYNAIHWLNENVSGDPVITEAVGEDYSTYGRISAFTGLPTIMGWVGHEYQWRINWFNQGNNTADFNYRATNDSTGVLNTIYTSGRPEVVLPLLARYHVKYVYVGPFEQAKYIGVSIKKLGSFLQVVYSMDGVTIFEVR